jgi:phospholipase/carboxylesterase
MDGIVIEHGARPDSAVLWLHGLGADGQDFAPVVPDLRLPDALRIRFVFPHAPIRPVTVNGGLRMRAWYDIFQLGPGPEDEPGIRASQALLEQMIRDQTSRGIAARRVVLAGFSQGGAVALQAGLRYPERLAGVIALSTYLPLAATLERERSDASLALPLFMAHGEHDDVIPLERATHSRDALLRAGYDVDWRQYPMPHAVCGEEIEALAAFLVRIL